MLPLISRFLLAPGIGLLPNRNCSVPPVTTPTVSAAGKYNPVLVSPELASDGLPAEPSAIAVRSTVAAAALVQAEPLLVKILPDVDGATLVTAPVPAPTEHYSPYAYPPPYRRPLRQAAKPTRSSDGHLL